MKDGLAGTPPPQRRVLVTGATGIVGGAITRALLEAAGVRLVIGDMLDPASDRSLPGGVDTVIHAAQYSIRGPPIT
jgi:uncharacterized protein YbjT (DUF2867 family)